MFKSKMKRTFFLCLSLAFCASAFGQKKLENQTLFTVGKDTVTAGEYMAVYNKNRNIGEDIDPKTPREYLDLYINFKLKVHEAKAMGMDTLPGFVREYGSYRDQLARPYLTDKDVTDELVREAYQRQQQDVRASHIMVAVGQGALPADTLEGYKTAMNIKKKLADGAPFDKMAEEYSADTHSAKNGGDLGYFTVFDMVYPFEDATYQAEVGKVVGPVRSRFGYHLIKTTDKRPARGTIQVAHIMLIDNEQSTPEESAQAKKRIQEIYDQLKDGSDFGTLARQYSEDKSTAKSSGRMQPFSINRMFPDFEEAAFGLEKPGDFSEPVKTPVGWHIIQLEKPHQPMAFEEAKIDLKNRIDRDSRSQQSEMSVLRRLKTDYNFREYPRTIEMALNQVDEEFLKNSEGEQKIKKGEETLFEFANRKYSVNDFMKDLTTRKKADKNARTPYQYADNAYSSFVKEKILEYEKSQLSKKYPEYRLLAREYFEGILLFDLTEDKVWQKSVKDSAGLRDFYAKHQDDYAWKERYQTVIVDAASPKLLKKTKKQLKKDKTLAQIQTMLNEDAPLNVKLDSAVYEFGKNETIEKTAKQQGFSDVMEENGRYQQVYFIKIIPAGRKGFDEARGAVISDYQEYLEKEWIAELKSKYDVNIQQDTLKKTIEELESQS